MVFVLFYVYVWARWLSRMVWCGGQNDFKIFISLVSQARGNVSVKDQFEKKQNIIWQSKSMQREVED